MALTGKEAELAGLKAVSEAERDAVQKRVDAIKHEEEERRRDHKLEMEAKVAELEKQKLESSLAVQDEVARMRVEMEACRPPMPLLFMVKVWRCREAIDLVMVHHAGSGKGRERPARGTRVGVHQEACSDGKKQECSRYRTCTGGGRASPVPA